ncbi:MAG: VOC family protein [Planctomycetota bacterium]
MGFPRSRGGPQDEFTSFAVGDGSLNLMTAADPPTGFWGRVIFHVTDVDAFYDRVRRAGLNPDFPPRDADWGERYFHLRDPDGHDLSFARLLKQQSE